MKNVISTILRNYIYNCTMALLKYTGASGTYRFTNNIALGVLDLLIEQFPLILVLLLVQNNILPLSSFMPILLLHNIVILLVMWSFNTETVHEISIEEKDLDNN